MERVSKADLQRWFGQFNQQYFKGRLSNWKLTVGCPPDPDLFDVGGWCYRETKTIYVTEQSLFDEFTAKSTLIHEMAHARVGSFHGKKFMSELTRLRNEGAPVSGIDFAERAPINAAYVRGSIDDALLEGFTLEQAQVHVGAEIGLSRKGLERRFPSASRGSGSIDLLKKRLYMYPYDKYHARQAAISLRKQGRSYRQIAAELTKAGYKTWRKRSYSPGAVWHLLNL